MIRVLASAALLCGIAAAAGPRHVRYSCDGGASFQARYFGRTAVVFVPGQSPLSLPQVRSASGARYSNADATLFTKGRDATFESGTLRLRNCKGSEAAAETTLTGTYVRRADSPIFTECGTGWQVTVARGDGFAELDRAFRQATSEVLAVVEGQVAMLPPAGDPSAPKRLVPTLVVRRLVSAQPGGKCGASADLEGRWRLMELAGEKPALEKPITIEFRGPRVAGFAGCNRFSGQWNATPDGLRFGPLVSTKMACAGPGIQWEDRFLKTLATATARRIDGNVLELQGPGGQTVARFERE